MKESTGEWNSALLSSVMRVGSVCMQVMGIQMYGIDPMGASSSGVQLPTKHGPHLTLHVVVVRDHKLQLWSHFMFYWITSTCYIAQVVNPMLLPFL